MSFDRSRQNWHQHQRGSPPSRNSAASASQVLAVRGSILESGIARSVRRRDPVLPAALEHRRTRRPGTATDMWTWTIRQPGASRWRTALRRISALRAVGEEPASAGRRTSRRRRSRSRPGSVRPRGPRPGSCVPERSVAWSSTHSPAEPMKISAGSREIRSLAASDSPASIRRYISSTVSRISVDGDIVCGDGHARPPPGQGGVAPGSAPVATGSPDRLQSEYEPTYRIGSGRPATRIASE